MRFWTILLLLLLGAARPLLAAESVINQQVIFTSSDGVQLAGTLTLPAEPGTKIPAAIFLQGSGPTDRDGNQPPNIRTDLMRQIAEALAQHGIASLRYDKRGMYANAASLPANTADYAAFFGWNHFIDDAYAGYEFLRKQPAIDPNRMALLGHSEGGLLALDLASRLRGEDAPHALVLISTPGRRMDAVLRDQIERALKQQKATQHQRRFYLAANDRIVKAIRDTGKVPDDVPTGLAAFYPSYIGPFWQAVMRLDPLRLARNFTGPVLLLQGEADRQISTEKDALALDQALQQRPDDDHALITLPQTSHNLKPLRGEEDAGLEGELDPELLRRLENWLLSKLPPDEPSTAAVGAR